MTLLRFKGLGRGAASLLMLYAGKVSGILVSLLFIPLYSRSLGDAQFGVVAVILSLQALLVMLDLGLSTLVGRDLAAGQQRPELLYRQLQDGAWLLGGFYLLLFVAVAALLPATGAGRKDIALALSCVPMFGLLTLQNLYYTAMLSRRHYVGASTIQFIGNVGRAVATAVVLTQYSATLLAFALTQAVCALLHALATAQGCRRLLRSDSGWMDGSVPGVRWQDCLALLRRGLPLALMMAAGAAVMQLDKPLISALMSSASTAPYFLAMTLCLVPTSVLAGPVTQYFQPQLLNAAAQPDNGSQHRIAQRFVVVLTAATLLPSLALWLLREPLLRLWLGEQANIPLIGSYVEILLPGIAIGSLGYLPYTLLLSAQDYRFQATLGTALSLATLGFAAVSVTLQSVAGVCFVYAGYHTISMLLSWTRAARLPATQHAARRSARTAAACVAATLMLALMLTAARRLWLGS